MVEEYGSEYPCDRSFRSPDIENYFYEGGLQIPQRYEMEPEEWTGIAHSYDLQVSLHHTLFQSQFVYTAQSDKRNIIVELVQHCNKMVTLSRFALPLISLVQ